MTRSIRRGFTLLEVAVGLALASVVLLAARATLGALGDSASRLSQHAIRLNADAHAATALRHLLALSGAERATGTPFRATDRAATFTSWCNSSGGWREECDVALQIVGDSIELVLRARSPSRRGYVVRTGLSRAGFIYLRSAANGGEWITSWNEAGRRPLAMGIAVDGDTTIIPLGAPN